MNWWTTGDGGLARRSSCYSPSCTLFLSWLPGLPVSIASSRNFAFSGMKILPVCLQARRLSGQRFHSRLSSGFPTSIFEPETSPRLLLQRVRVGVRLGFFLVRTDSHRSSRLSTTSPSIAPGLCILQTPPHWGGVSLMRV